MVAAPAGLSEPPIGDRVEADAFWVAFDPDKQSGPRCIEGLFFVAPGNGGQAPGRRRGKWGGASTRAARGACPAVGGAGGPTPGGPKAQRGEGKGTRVKECSSRWSPYH